LPLPILLYAVAHAAAASEAKSLACTSMTLKVFFSLLNESIEKVKGGNMRTAMHLLFLSLSPALSLPVVLAAFWGASGFFSFAGLRVFLTLTALSFYSILGA